MSVIAAFECDSTNCKTVYAIGESLGWKKKGADFKPSASCTLIFHDNFETTICFTKCVPVLVSLDALYYALRGFQCVYINDEEVEFFSDGSGIRIGNRLTVRKEEIKKIHDRLFNT